MTPLNAADHFTLMMDHEVRKSGLAGNLCALVIELDVCPDKDTLSKKTRSFTRRFPLAVASLKKTGRRYAWADRNEHPNIFFHYPYHDAENSDTFQTQTLKKIINRKQALEDILPVELHLIEGEEKSLLALRWFHPLCDAKGIELILHHILNEEHDTKHDNTPVGLDAWLAKQGLWKKIKFAFKARNNIRQLDQLNSTLLNPADKQTDTLDFQVIRYNKEQTANINTQARQYAGMTGTALYFIGCMMRTLETIGCDHEGDGFCVPYAFNLRKRKALFPIFGNHVSFLFSQASRKQLQSKQQLFEHLKEQNKYNIRNALDFAMLPLMEAGSWLNLDRFGEIVRKNPQGTERSSFWFSYTGEIDPPMTKILGCNVTGLFQISPVTAPPSFGILVSQLNGELTISYCFIPEYIPEEKLTQITKRMSLELMDNT